jgi:hypothetical protein
MLLTWLKRWENLGGQKAQESKWPRPGLILWVAHKGYGFFGGMKPLKRRYQAEEGLIEKRQIGWFQWKRWSDR